MATAKASLNQTTKKGRVYWLVKDQFASIRKHKFSSASRHCLSLELDLCE
jgi:hypothetical protein